MLYDKTAIRRFARIDLLPGTVPNESTILRFRHLLQPHACTAQMFDAQRALLEEQRLQTKAGDIVEATIIGAPS